MIKPKVSKKTKRKTCTPLLAVHSAYHRYVCTNRTKTCRKARLIYCMCVWIFVSYDECNRFSCWQLSGVRKLTKAARWETTSACVVCVCVRVWPLTIRSCGRLRLLCWGRKIGAHCNCSRHYELMFMFTVAIGPVGIASRILRSVSAVAKYSNAVFFIFK